jgi:protein-disulfide isomerase
MSKQFWALLLIIVLAFVGVVVYTDHKNTSDQPVSKGQPTNHVEGKGTGGVTLVEYGDFQCPVCATFFAVTQQVQAKYNDQIKFQFRNLPLTSLHPNAFSAARAAEAAGLQGKYFEMHDLLYQNQTIWSSSSTAFDYFTQYAQQLKLNTTKFSADYKSTKVNDAINADITAFKKTGDDMATPTYYLNGKKIENTQLLDASNQPSVAAFSKLIDAALAAQSKKS